MHSTKCRFFPSQSSEILKNLHSFNFPSSLLELYSAESFDVHSTKCSVSLPLIEPYSTRNTEEHPLRSFFPILRRVKTQKHAKIRKHSLPSEIPDVSTKTNQLHLLIVD